MLEGFEGFGVLGFISFRWGFGYFGCLGFFIEGSLDIVLWVLISDGIVHGCLGAGGFEFPLILLRSLIGSSV